MLILYVGPDYPGSNGTCFRDALADLGHEVITLNAESYFPAPANLVAKVKFKLTRRPAQALLDKFNSEILALTQKHQPQIIFFIQARYVTGETLQQTGKIGANFVYMNDDMFNSSNQTYTFHEAIREMHCIFTTKSYNVAEFIKAGAPQAIYFPNAYDPKIHYPAQPAANEWSHFAGDIGFVGTFRPDRANFLAALIKRNKNWKMNIWGGGWEKMGRFDNWHRQKRWKDLFACVRGKELWCEQMGKAMTANKISLGLLNPANRDLHTSRSFEIPACAGFMLAERTSEHQEYFTEDKEAVYFDAIEELSEKASFYLTHEAARVRIAQAGYQRCLRSEYRYIDRARFVLNHYEKLR